ncbi:MAG: hypothetical protein BWY11_00586 [Firmicutes bacterium ADurb.Bin182]|nr:MAG: hypothetical protein BWY11_00586 [Firmicutes bacterium ADurb.Bin182]
MTSAFIIYASMIPLVPLFGAGIFKKRKDNVKKNVCIGLFVLQTLLSIGYIITWLKAH